MFSRKLMDLTTALTPSLSETNKQRLREGYSSSAFEAKLPKEYDEHQRKVEIWLFCRGVSSSASDDIGGAIATISKQYAHWLLVFEFEDSAVRIIEGVNEGEKLEPLYTKYNQGNCTRIKHLDTRTMSPVDIRKLAVENIFNGLSYTLGSMNCQTWVNEVLEKLGLQPLSSTLNSDIKRKAISLVSVSGNPAGLGLGLVLAAQNLQH